MADVQAFPVSVRPRTSLVREITPEPLRKRSGDQAKPDSGPEVGNREKKPLVRLQTAPVDVDPSAKPSEAVPPVALRYEIGAAIQYWSASYGKWVDCTCQGVQATGEIQISCKMGYWMPVDEQDEKVRIASATVVEEEKTYWSASHAIGLGARGSESLFEGKAQVLDEAVVTSAHGAVNYLNSGKIQCPGCFCVVYSASTDFYILLYRSDCEEKALEKLGLSKEVEVQPRSLGPKPVRDPNSVITPAATAPAAGSPVPISGWGPTQNIGLGPRGAEAVFEGKIRLLEESVVSSMNKAVDMLSRGIIQCPEGYCVVYSASSESYILLFREECEERALELLGCHKEAPQGERQSPAQVKPQVMDFTNLPVMVIAPGGGTRSNAAVYSALNTKEHMKVRIAGQSGTKYDRYPPQFTDGQEAPNLESFAADLLSEGVCDAGCLVFGSRGGQVVLPALWKFRGDAVPPVVVINGGCAMDLPRKPAWPVKQPIFMIVGGQDYFKGPMSDDKYFAKNKAAVPAGSVTCAILFVKQMAHMPKPRLLEACLNSAIRAVVTWKATGNPPIEAFGAAVAALNRGGWSGRLAFTSAPGVWQDLFFP